MCQQLSVCHFHCLAARMESGCRMQYQYLQSSVKLKTSFVSRCQRLPPHLVQCCGQLQCVQVGAQLHLLAGSLMQHHLHGLQRQGSKAQQAHNITLKLLKGKAEPSRGKI